MGNFSTNIRTPVRREHAEHFILLTLVSFAITAVGVRLFLTLTGFPKVGGGDFHIAHLLWGGLALLIACLVLLIFANRWVYVAGGILTGVGVGLFIDEVGKFITINNDYFFPLAMPVIYAVFLVVVLIYLRVSRVPVSNQPRAELYRALETFQEVLDRDLSESECNLIKAQLRTALNEPCPDDLKALAQALLNYVESSNVSLAPQKPGFFAWVGQQSRAFEAKNIGQKRLKIILAVGMGIIGLLALSRLVSFGAASLSPTYLQSYLTSLTDSGEIATKNGAVWFFAQLGLEGAVGLILVIAAILLAAGRDDHGINLGYLGLLLSLTVVNLLIFYYAQFGNVFLTLIEAFLLLGLMHYRKVYLPLEKH